MALTYPEILSDMTDARERYETLLAGTRPEELERVKQRLAEAQARLRQLRNGFRKEEIAQAKSAVEAAQAKVQWIRTQLDAWAATAVVLVGPAFADHRAWDGYLAAATGTPERAASSGSNVA